jgi:putative SOS response-associated peptidase YedK
MCYHTAVAATYSQLEERYQKPFQGDLFPSFNNKQDIVAHHVNAFTWPHLPVISMDDKEHINSYQWGLIPSWVNNQEQANLLRNQTFNAKMETVFEKPSFKHSIAYQRCLIPATGFFEWQTKNAQSKQPHYIYLPNYAIFSFAAIYAIWLNPINNKTYRTFSILTTKANSLMENIHNSKQRMPCILKPEYEMNWLDENLVQAEIESLLVPIEDKEMEAYPISHLITQKGKSSNVPEVIRPIPKPFGDLFS